MKTLLYQSSLFIHILCGIAGLTSGFVAMLARRKGQSLHNRAGRVFYWSMLGVFVTTVIFFMIAPDQLRYQFFLGIGIVSFYPAYSGKRILAMKKAINPNWLDRIAFWLVGLCGVIMIAYAVLINDSLYRTLFGIFGVVCIQNFVGDWRLYTGRTTPERMHWFFAHGMKMTGAFSAAMTAFCVNILPKLLEGYLNQWTMLMTWILPGVLIGLWGNLLLKKYRKSQGKVSQSPLSLTTES